ncbi:hypothetical protein [Polyangium jinanense]|uniref:Uncharacterized protein n=1 Tax=Polyangium jinanense TaxID=2829994 RepID=A0A9X4AXE2_9BACT|nr:hypothetical protein [Polyangium jinanense]MDC3961797.1 hypothetical protein [Polyangium jinanense]MDC3988309.1 hypothetical protein [Polyangium jinanense]
MAAALLTAFREETAKLAKGDEGPRYYDRKSFPWGERAFERLTGQGKIRSFKAPDGKTILVLREEAHAFIEAQEGARPRAPRPPPQARDLAAVDVNALSPAEEHELAMRRHAERKDGSRRRNGPATRRSP